ncbi:SpoIIE family protein phosphatase [Actinospica sp.]|uniref:SpoIIE family protein phosphatase n=1 Tax=Actinospica sp. TaxID=1872142 RepID=UPI002C09DD1E|nr:SpoIIE family protein phosphatase [Actinospica sp.]HWG23664.1 SpoIIE family protein phosphatase [Actinospica sp.]
MRAHERQDAAERRLRAADAAPLLLDAHAAVISWTADAERLLGYPAAEALGRAAAELLLPQDAARVPELADRCRTDGGWSGMLTARHRDGHPVEVAVRIVSVEDGRGPTWLVLLEERGRARGWDMSRGVLGRMVSHSPVGMAIVDTDLRYVWSNAALARFGGGPPLERLGKRLADVQPGLDAAQHEVEMRRVLETGVPVIGFEQVGRVRSAPHRETAFELTFTRLEDDQGRPIGVFYTVADITERHRARQRLALLDKAGQRMGRTLDVMRAAQELADVAVPGLADFVTVDLLESVPSGMEPARGVSDQELVQVRRAGHQSVNEDVPETAVEIGAVASYLAGSPLIRCLVGGRSWRRERLDPLATEWVADPPGGRQATFRELGLHSVMIVPIQARGITLGVTTFFRRTRQDPFDEDDLSLAEDLVARAAVCLDNARRYTRERGAALVLQRNLLPHHLPEQEAVEVAACYRPADELTGLGGDWYDVIPLSSARVALVVGEVPGHGIDAAAAMGRLRAAVRTLADLDLPPEEVLAHLDDLVAQATRDEEGEPGALWSGAQQTVGTNCVYVVYDPATGQCAMASAGHPVPALIAPDGEVSFAELPVGPVLGVGGPPFESVEFTVPEGTTFALHTDGLLEFASTGDGRAGDPEAARDRLRRSLEPAGLPQPSGPSLDQWCRTVVDKLVPERPSDDAALLLARTRRLSTEQFATWDLPTDPAVVSEARKRATVQLAAWGLDDLAFTTELVVSELVTNAIRHAIGPVRLRLIVERALICEVFDGGATAPHLRHPKTTDEGGRGLFLISQFTQRWGTRYTPTGKIIWAEQSLTEPAL